MKANTRPPAQRGPGMAALGRVIRQFVWRTHHGATRRATDEWGAYLSPRSGRFASGLLLAVARETIISRCGLTDGDSRPGQRRTSNGSEKEWLRKPVLEKRRYVL